jgi:predicted Zn-dependent protease
VSGETDERSEATEEALEQAASLAEEGRWDEARDALLERLEEDPENPELLCWLGIASREMGAEGEAYELFRRALAGTPRDPFVLASIGQGLAALDDPDAEGVLRLAALSAPEFPLARLAYGAYLAREGLFPEAAAELEAARGLAPEDVGVRAELAIAYLLAGRGEEGVEELESALALDAEDAWLRALYGMALLEAGRGGEGAEELHRASLERVEDVELQLLSALAAAGEGWEEEAWNALSRAEAAAEEVDAMLVQEVEERIEAGPEEALEFLRRELLAPTLRERLLQRP